MVGMFRRNGFIGALVVGGQALCTVKQSGGNLGICSARWALWTPKSANSAESGGFAAFGLSVQRRNGIIK